MGRGSSAGTAAAGELALRPAGRLTPEGDGDTRNVGLRAKERGLPLPLAISTRFAVPVSRCFSAVRFTGFNPTRVDRRRFTPRGGGSPVNRPQKQDSR